jgi:plasmid stabilization system protein ParE
MSYVIYDYLVHEAPASADRIVDALLDACDSLALHGERGARPRDSFLRDQGYRFLVCGRYLILYKVTKRTVRVYRILPGKTDYRHLL